MHRLRRADSLRDPDTYAKIRKLAAEITRKLKAEKIILFGSFARGDYHEKSDVDFIVVAPFKERFFERIGKVLECNQSDLALEALPYTLEEFERKKNEPFFKKALAEGILLV